MRALSTVDRALNFQLLIRTRTLGSQIDFYLTKYCTSFVQLRHRMYIREYCSLFPGTQMVENSPNHTLIADAGSSSHTRILNYNNARLNDASRRILISLNNVLFMRAYLN